MIFLWKIPSHLPWNIQSTDGNRGKQRHLWKRACCSFQHPPTARSDSIQHLKLFLKLTMAASEVGMMTGVHTWKSRTGIYMQNGWQSYTSRNWSFEAYIDTSFALVQTNYWKWYTRDLKNTLQLFWEQKEIVSGIPVIPASNLQAQYIIDR